MLGYIIIAWPEKVKLRNEFCYTQQTSRYAAHLSETVTWRLVAYIYGMMILVRGMGQPVTISLTVFLRWRLKSSGMNHPFDDTWANPWDLKSPESNPGTV